MKINGWKRIGIVASIIWMLSAGIYTFVVINNETEQAAQLSYSQCAAIRDEGNQNQREYCGHESEVAAIDSIEVFNKCMADYDAAHPDECLARSVKYAVDALPGERIEAALAAIVPVPFGWGLAYLILFLVRWVKRGFIPA